MSSETQNKNKRRKVEYKCQFCDKTYRKPSKVIEHERSHTGERPYICNYPGCGKSYMRSTHLSIHQQTHKNVKEFVCSYENCTKAYTLKQHLQRHEKTHISPLLECDYPGCEAKFAKRYQLRWHKASHEKGNYICDVCQAALNSLPALEKHKSRMHENPVIYNCSSCEMDFNKWSDLRKHIHDEHPAKCTICDKTFSRTANLKQHIREKHTDLYQIKCDWPGCKATLNNKRSYKTHVALVHEQDIRYKCDVCEKGFPYKSQLERHMESHTLKLKKPKSPKRQKSIIEEITGHNYYAKADTKYECPIPNCQFKFTNTYLLQRHLEGSLHKDDIKALKIAKASNVSPQ
ncbi:hypothetical protein BDF20DRAFT_286254 [Mycotypha africana]|uniref:uncharacterized protein n=1 Tax=Mycotypha africana TaxID=64632 RepID=UPI0023011447|nr:uncharacterized protein BDF20DRAFT_286254 [Mycotypha africana]KAI8987728.1 hypothetical protein BDF20DRAFT_286254 [Mycotypha africana]